MYGTAIGARAATRGEKRGRAMAWEGGTHGDGGGAMRDAGEMIMARHGLRRSGGGGGERSVWRATDTQGARTQKKSGRRRARCAAAHAHGELTVWASSWR
eukprot:CAMPEP_0115868958 /NCGR_PEP_ID=MMETSP0287-20121206/21561_1 /TAXON_ID=412157 /ORGANISM="Chrysochromulina rotalis, Strain UIO044" /LENGTH=99 /DNA_ID=CAMNT_0003323629 /DNA_START=67 /DNA_END=366 /DNA_ORIENTATION=-